MSSRSLKITLRFAAAILLIFAAICFAVDAFSSFHTEERPTPNGGFTIDHTLAISHVVIITALVGLLLLAFSFRGSRKRA
jgi:formate hydrogenlyase subunit 3/multisubunit Na+/H+ antiporter MnhD subunit